MVLQLKVGAKLVIVLLGLPDKVGFCSLYAVKESLPDQFELSALTHQ